MAVKVRIPAPLRKLTQEQPVVDIQGKTIEEILANLEKNYPGIKERICDENGQIRRFINVFVNGEDIRFKDGAKTSVAEGPRSRPGSATCLRTTARRRRAPAG